MSVPLLFVVATLASGAAVVQPPAPAVPRQVSVDGCVATGAEVGRKADLAEKTGLDKHFVLLGAKVVKGKGPWVAMSTPATAAGSMFKINGLTDEQLTIHVGRRVRIEGSFGSLEEQASESSPASPQDNLVELNVATIRQVPGACAVPKS